MAREYHGSLAGEGLRFGIVVARFNETITSRLLAGAQDALRRHGVAEDSIEVAWVPGSLEAPLIAKKMAESGRYNAIICLAAVIRGATYHFELVASGIAQGVSRVMLETNVPVLFGVLTTDTIEQALERSGTKAGNKGFDAAVGAIEMANLMRALDSQPPPR